MADIAPTASGGVVMTLDAVESAYVLACLGASNTTLFPGLLDGRPSLYRQLGDAMLIPLEREVRDPSTITTLYRQLADVLETWTGRPNYKAARSLSERYGLYERRDDALTTEDV